MVRPASRGGDPSPYRGEPPRIPALVATRRPDVRALLETRCESCYTLPTLDAVLDAGAIAAWVTLDESVPDGFGALEACAGRHTRARLGLLAPMTVRLARMALRSGVIDVLWWPVSEEEFDRSTWGLIRPAAGAWLERLARASEVWDAPVSVTLRELSVPTGPIYCQVSRLARSARVSERELRRAWSEALAPWTPKATLDWVLWLRALAYIEAEAEEAKRRPALQRVAGALKVRERSLNQASVRRTGYRFLDSVREPGRSVAFARLEGEWRRVLADA